MCSPNSISPIVLNNIFLALIQYLIKVNMVDLIVIFLLIYKIPLIFCFEFFGFPWLIFQESKPIIFQNVSRIDWLFSCDLIQLNIFGKNTTLSSRMFHT